MVQMEKLRNEIMETLKNTSKPKVRFLIYFSYTLFKLKT